jgi:putative ABC transport system permease protein
MDDLITANLRARPTRTLISVFAVAIGVILMLVIGGITSGTLNDYLERTMLVGADVILMPTGDSIFYAMNTGAALPVRLTDKIATVSGVSAVTPVLSKFMMKKFGLVFGIDIDSYDKFPGRLQIVEGKRSLTGDEVIVDQLYAKNNKVEVGQTLTFFDHDFTVTAICREGAVVRVFVPLKTLQILNGTPDRVSTFYIKAAPGKDPKALIADLHSAFPMYSLLDASDPNTLLADTRVPGLQEFRVAVILVSVLISFMVILLAMYSTIFERTREIGILKSLGASRGFIVRMVLRESVIISCLGALLGTGLSELIRKLIISVFPTLKVTISLGEISTGCLLGLIGGILGGLYPAYKAALMDPVKALSYE